MLTTNDFLNSQVSLWQSSPEQASQLAKFIKNNPANIYGFGRYLWNQISSGQMPPELNPSFHDDLIIFSPLDSPLPSLVYANLSSHRKTPKMSAPLETINGPEKDFNGGTYLIIDQTGMYHFLRHTHNFVEPIKSCFFIPNKKLSAELHERVNDKEKIKIDSGASPRC